MNSTRIPLLYETDVFIAGAGSSAVAAALAVRQKGRSAVVASDLSYFGDECAGALRVWPKRESEDPLFRRLFAPGRAAPPTPLQIKRALESELLQAGIPFLYNVRPVALLRSSAGAIRGVVLAHRTALYGVAFHTAIDLTRQGLLADLAGSSFPIERAAPATLDWIVLSNEAPTPDRPKEGFAVEEAGAPFTLNAADAKAISTLRAWRLTFPGPFAAGDLRERAALEHRLRARLVNNAVQYTAEILPIPPARRIADDGRPADDPLRLADESLRIAPRLFLANGRLPVSDSGVAALEEVAVQIELGARLGRMAAEAPALRPVRAFALSVGRDGARGPFDFSPSYARERDGLRWITVDFKSAPPIGEYDVLVAGGGTGGAPAGIAAAREGARTVVLETQHGLGGVGTLGFIASYCFGNRVGFTRELDEDLDRYRVGDPDRGTHRWRPELKNGWYQRALLDAGGAAWFGSFVFGVKREGDRVVGALISTPYGMGYAAAGALVDASGNADIAAAAGAPVRLVDARHVAVQGTGLSPRKAASGYNNSDHSFVDDNDPIGVTHAFANARAKFPDHFDISTMINSRERRQIVGEIELSPLDFLARRTFPDTINIAYSNFDTHGFTIHPAFLIVPPDKGGIYANVPFRCLLPRDVEGVLAIGLGMSAHRDALPVIRMQGDVQNQGYAAGLAAARAARKHARFRDLDIRELQRRLIAIGALPPEIERQEDSFPLPAETVRQAAREGPTDLYRTAILFAHPEIAAPVLAETLKTDSDPRRREDAALALGLMRRPEAAGALAEIVRSRGWDAGWNFKGMGQFGMSASRMDALIIALGRAASAPGVTAENRAAAIAALREKIEALDGAADFSHCRAVSVAAGALGEPALAAALARLLCIEGVTGHAQLDSAAVVASANREMNETRARNDALRELYLARGLYLCGDEGGLGRTILETYTRDLRGHFARHAAAVLAERDLEKLRAEAI